MYVSQLTKQNGTRHCTAECIKLTTRGTGGSSQIAVSPQGVCQKLFVISALTIKFGSPTVMPKRHASAKRQRVPGPTQASATYDDDTDQCRTDVDRILTACNNAELQLADLKMILQWKIVGPVVVRAVTTPGYTQRELVPGIIRLLKSLAVLLEEHRDDVKHELQQTPYCIIFAEETSRRRLAIRTIITDLKVLLHIEPDTYNKMLFDTSKYFSGTHRDFYAKLLAAVEHLFSGKKNKHFLSYVPVYTWCVYVTGVA